MALNAIFAKYTLHCLQRKCLGVLQKMEFAFFEAAVWACPVGRDMFPSCAPGNPVVWSALRFVVDPPTSGANPILIWRVDAHFPRSFWPIGVK